MQQVWDDAATSRVLWEKRPTLCIRPRFVCPAAAQVDLCAKALCKQSPTRTFAVRPIGEASNSAFLAFDSDQNLGLRRCIDFHSTAAVMSLKADVKAVRALLQSGDSRGALTACQALLPKIKASPEDAAVLCAFHVTHGLAATACEAWGEATEAYRAATELQPDLPQAWKG